MGTWVRWIAPCTLVVAGACSDGNGGNYDAGRRRDSGREGSTRDGAVNDTGTGPERDAGFDATTEEDAATAQDSGNEPDGTAVEPDASDAATSGMDASDAATSEMDASDAATSGMDATVDTGVDACTPGITCEGNTAVTCADGVLTSQSCGSQVCVSGLGCAVCAPGSGTCAGNTGTRCKDDGTGYETNQCDPLQGLSCDQGACTGACANVRYSYIGCDYYAVTMANTQLNQSRFSFSVSISNAGTAMADVRIERAGMTPITGTIAPGALREFTLPWVNALSIPSGSTTSPGTSRVAGGAYRIRSTQPVTVYQFSPRDYRVGSIFPTYSYTNDASLLLPVGAMTGNYRVTAWPTWRACSGTRQLPGIVDIVATENDTHVTIATTGTIQTGAGLGARGGTITLQRGDVVQLASALNGASTCSFGADLSGSAITADHPIEVLGGHDCTYIPSDQAACDHLEEVNFPVETLRSDYLVVVPYNQNGTPRHYVKIVGTENGTMLHFEPAVQSDRMLGAGEVLTFDTTSHFRVTSTAPIAVAQYLMSQNVFSSTASTAGDPSQSTAVATAQFRRDYRFTAPANYAQNWVSVIAPVGASVSIDGNASAVTNWANIGTSGYRVGRASLCGNNASGCTGVHTATSTQPFGIQVYGYGSYTSYFYPGGLDLAQK